MGIWDVTPEASVSGNRITLFVSVGQQACEIGPSSWVFRLLAKIAVPLLT
ncbi:MAG: hypothetical protein ACI8P0_005003 [Planctomycetaceae bacterium]|jgi:hypothetical protein